MRMRSLGSLRRVAGGKVSGDGRGRRNRGFNLIDLSFEGVPNKCDKLGGSRREFEWRCSLPDADIPLFS